MSKKIEKADIRKGFVFAITHRQRRVRIVLVQEVPHRFMAFFEDLIVRSVNRPVRISIDLADVQGCTSIEGALKDQ